MSKVLDAADQALQDWHDTPIYAELLYAREVKEQRFSLQAMKLEYNKKPSNSLYILIVIKEMALACLLENKVFFSQRKNQNKFGKSFGGKR